jgi:glycosyltransferase involved in cell wall biosynthesis
VTAGKIIVQPTGIDEERFCFSPEKRRQIRTRYRLTDHDVLVGNVGFIRHYKGHEFILRTAAQMPERFRFMLVGGGRDLPLMQAEADRLGVRDKIIFTGHRENPEDFFSAFDILFFSSWGVEGVAQSFIQGLLYGLPLLVCRTPSILEPLAHVHTSRVIDYGNVPAAAGGLSQLADDLHRNEQKIAEQRQAIAAKYGLRAMMDNLLRLYARFGIVPPA